MHVISSFIRNRCKRFYGVLRVSENGRIVERAKLLNAATEEEAKLELRLYEREVDPEHGISAIEYARRYHMGRAQRRSIEPSTLKGYLGDVGAWERYIGNAPMSALDPQMIEDALGAMFDDGVAPTTVDRRYSQLRSACVDAMRRGILAANPFEGLDRPKKATWSRNAVVGAERERMRDDILSMKPSRLKVAAALAFFAGLRVAETCGTQTNDIQMSERVGWVRHAVGTGPDGPYLKAAKSNNLRDYPLCDYLFLVLDEWAQTGPWLLAGSRFAHPSAISKSWASFAKDRGYIGLEGRRPTFHDLRHTFATAAVSAGMDVRTLQSILGHADASITLKVYASADPNAKMQAAKLIDGYF